MRTLEKDIIREWLEDGKEKNATHMIIIYESWYGNYSNYYVKEDENLEDILHYLLSGVGIKKVIGIYNYDLDLEEQLLENHPNHREKNKKYIKMYNKALKYATIKHEGKYRKGYDHKPYITHPIEVSKLVEKYMQDDYQLDIYKVAALLHDTLEDTDATYDEISKLFGKQIADIVLELTNDKDEKNRLGKDIYLANKMSKMNDKTLILKLCDRLHNVSELINADDEFNEKYVRETIYIINYLLLYRKLDNTHLTIINDIMNEVKKVSKKSPMLIKPRRKVLENTKMPQ